jgi:hypothetical protein
MPLMLQVWDRGCPASASATRRTIIERAEIKMSESDSYIVREY